MGTYKRALEKVRKEALEKFYESITPNLNTPSSMSLAEITFTIKIKTLFDKLVPGQKIKRKALKIRSKNQNWGRIVFLEYIILEKECGKTA